MLCAYLKFSLRCLLGSSIGQTTATLLSAAPDNEGHDFFEKNIRPVLVEHCYKCHSAAAEKLKGDLLLDTREGMLKGGESGKPAIVPGDAERSRLIEAIRYANDDLHMPPKKAGGRLSDDQINDFVTWINLGAPDPRSGKAESRKPKAGGFGRSSPRKNRRSPKSAMPAGRRHRLTISLLPDSNRKDCSHRPRRTSAP